MLNKEERLLQQELEVTLKINDMVTGNLMPEEETLLKRRASPGLHIHDDENPLGMHRHHLGDNLDGAHIHTPENPAGEHAHGELKKQALINGAHTHDYDGFGDHNHDND